MRYYIAILLFIANLITINLNAQKIDVKKNDLLNGRLYQEKRTNIVGHPFLKDDKFHSSNIYYKGINYENLLLKYNIFRQEIIYYQEIDIEQPRFILLNLDYLEKFEINYDSDKLLFTSEFSNLNGLDSKIEYYQLIYDGNFKYIKGSEKRIEKLAVKNRYDQYVENNYYYLIVNNKPYRIKNKKDFIQVFINHKKEIRKFIKKNHLKIKPWSHGDIIKLIIFCESL